MEMRTENWCGYEIRFVEIEGEWWAILKDICEALGLKSKKVSERLETGMMHRIKIETSKAPLKDHRSRGENETRWMLAVNEPGIYATIFSSRKVEARKFRMWTYDTLKKLRSFIGLQGYEVMQMLDESNQLAIDDILDTLFYDEETGQLMQSVTVAGGDVEQVPFELS